jgi:membrane protein implicated in regulation of membrane protease activity
MELTPSAWHIWIIVGLLLGALEIMLSGFVMLWFALGAFASAIAAGVGLGVNVQLLVFTVISVALFLSSRTIFKKAFMRNTAELKQGLDAMIGGEATVVEPLPAAGNGTVRINGELWSARSMDGAISEGELVRVESVEGLKLRVRRHRDALFTVHKEGTER